MFLPSSAEVGYYGDFFPLDEIKNSD
jgi:hypothetical protein